MAAAAPYLNEVASAEDLPICLGYYLARNTDRAGLVDDSTAGFMFRRLRALHGFDTASYILVAVQRTWTTAVQTAIGDAFAYGHWRDELMDNHCDELRGRLDELRAIHRASD